MPEAPAPALAAAALAASAGARRRRLPVALLGLEAYDFLVDLFERSRLLGSGFGVLLALAAAGALGLGASEIPSLRRLTVLGDLRLSATHLYGSQVHGQADPLLGSVERVYRDRTELRRSSSGSMARRAMR